MPPVRCWQVDAFTDRPFGGNPAAVCWLEGDASETWMQAVASEMNLSETAYVRRRDDGDYDLRWFTPAVEVSLCGHATLASAHALWTHGLAEQNVPLRFHTKSGLLTCTRQGDSIEMDFPAQPPTVGTPKVGLLAALGVAAPQFAGRTLHDEFVVLESADELRALKPDFRQLSAVPTRGVIVTAQSDDSRYDFLSRFFAPAAGIDEDPVTGSAHCALAPYWSQRLKKLQLTAYQASPRGGTLRLQHNGDRVRLAGQAVTVWQGELLAAP